MARNKLNAATFLLGIILFTGGCAFLTAQRVGTFAAKQVGTHIVKKAIKSHKEEEDEKKKREKAQRERAKSEESREEERGETHSAEE